MLPVGFMSSVSGAGEAGVAGGGTAAGQASGVPGAFQVVLGNLVGQDSGAGQVNGAEDAVLFGEVKQSVTSKSEVADEDAGATDDDLSDQLAESGLAMPFAPVTPPVSSLMPELGALSDGSGLAVGDLAAATESGEAFSGEIQAAVSGQMVPEFEGVPQISAGASGQASPQLSASASGEVVEDAVDLSGQVSGAEADVEPMLGEAEILAGAQVASSEDDLSATVGDVETDAATSLSSEDALAGDKDGQASASEETAPRRRRWRDGMPQEAQAAGASATALAGGSQGVVSQATDAAIAATTTTPATSTQANVEQVAGASAQTNAASASAQIVAAKADGASAASGSAASTQVDVDQAQASPLQVKAQDVATSGVTALVSGQAEDQASAPLQNSTSEKTFAANISGQLTTGTGASQVLSDLAEGADQAGLEKLTIRQGGAQAAPASQDLAGDETALQRSSADVASALSKPADATAAGNSAATAQPQVAAVQAQVASTQNKPTSGAGLSAAAQSDPAAADTDVASADLTSDDGGDLDVDLLLPGDKKAVTGLASANGTAGIQASTSDAGASGAQGVTQTGEKSQVIAANSDGKNGAAGISVASTAATDVAADDGGSGGDVDSLATLSSQPMSSGEALASGKTTNLPSPNQAQSGQVATQVAAAMSKNLAKGDTSFQMRFDPPELGRVEVHMKVGSDGSVQTHMVVERPETLDMFLRDQRGLERAFQEAGLKADTSDLQFSLQDQSGNSSFAGGDQGSEGGSGSNSGIAGLQDGDGLEDTASAAEVAARYSGSEAGGLDIRI